MKEMSILFSDEYDSQYNDALLPGTNTNQDCIVLV
jgi:hypothetical protein